MLPGAPTIAAIQDAQAVLAPALPETRLTVARSLVSPDGHAVLLKHECELPTGSFKVRGALYALTARLRRQPIREVVASSTGNHGAAVAWAAQQLGVPARIFLPGHSNPVKRERIRSLGARIVETGRDITDAWAAAEAAAEQDGVWFLNDATDPDLPAGPGTIAVEILERAPEVTRFIVPVGDTALIRGIAAAVRHRKPEATVVGVQAERAPAYTLSWRRGESVHTETCDTVADGLATRTTVPANVAAIRRLVDDFVLVREEELLDAVLELLLQEHVVTEPAGAAALAAWRKAPAHTGPTALILSGGNLSRAVLDRAVSGR